MWIVFEIDRVLRSFLKFVGDSTLIAHNASFDIRMINQELARLEQEIEGFSVPQLKVSDAFDTQAYLRLRFPSLP